MKRIILLCAAGSCLFAYVFYQNAWVTDDAFITFRSVEQVMAGNGPRWNPHERVQVYTHPLWFFLQLLFRVCSKDVFINAVVASFLCCVGMLVALGAMFRDASRWFLAVLLVVSSKSLMDYMTSGLENPLSYLLLSVFFCLLVRRDGGSPVNMDSRTGDGASGDARVGRPVTAKDLFWLVFSWSLLLLCRHDHLMLTLPAMGWVFFHEWKRAGGKKTLGIFVAGLAPFILWTLFSVVYYGFPFPNSAYAKLRTGLPLFPGGTDPGMGHRGAVYLGASFFFDPMILALLMAACLMLLQLEKRGRKSFLWLGWGVLLHLLYVLRAGGDYMAGRFLTSVVLVCILVCVAWADTDRKYAGVALAAVLFCLLLPASPVKSTPGYSNPRPAMKWVSDERALYFPATSLHQHLTTSPEQYFLQRPMIGRWYRYGLGFRKAEQRITIHGNVGILGYTAGTDKIIIDCRGITDPLLARLPALPGKAGGHFDRAVPRGYIQSVVTGQNRIEDPEVAALYDTIREITQGPVFTVRRFAAILKANIVL